MYGQNESIISVFVLAIIIYFVWKAVQRSNTVSLALRRFTINPDAENQITIEGRKTGFIQWLLVLFHFGNTYKINVKKNYISYSSESIQGESLTLTPVQKIASTSCGYRNPIGLLIAAAIVFLIGLIFYVSSRHSFYGSASGMGLFYTIVIALILVGIYFYNKRFYISIQTMGGYNFVLSFRGSLVENVFVNITNVKEVVERINELVLTAQ